MTAGGANGDAAAARLWRRDPSLWSTDASVQEKIANRLGWLSSPTLMAGSIGRLHTFADAVKRDGLAHVVLLGMGGSSLAPEVLRAVVGVGPGWPQFQMLDSTDPAAVRAAATPPERTLYVLASKSGTTIEPNALAAHFRERLEARGAPWNDHFIAITDEGTDLARRAGAERFRDLFINPSDIGGRYSAVSYFGFVPAALMGQDLNALVGWSLAMLSAAEPADRAGGMNPAVALGLLIGEAARAGRDKLTLILPPELGAFGLWVEQLIAESTGKHGVGVVPIAGEPVAAPDHYAADRVFVAVRLDGSPAEQAQSAAIQSLKAAGAPVAEIEMPEAAALGGEFLRWEIATAMAGAILQINPFDEPNVQQAKDATRTLLERYKSSGQLQAPSPSRTWPNGVTIASTAAAREQLGDRGAEAALSLLRAGDYFALLAYVGPNAEIAQVLEVFRHNVRDRTRAATMLGYGPRYLHSTGQLHKGGRNTGVFVLLTADDAADLPIPGESFSFGTLEMAQALGDFASLESAGRRAIHVHLPRPEARLVREVATTMLDQLPHGT